MEEQEWWVESRSLSKRCKSIYHWRCGAVSPWQRVGTAFDICWILVQLLLNLCASTITVEPILQGCIHGVCHLYAMYGLYIRNPKQNTWLRVFCFFLSKFQWNPIFCAWHSRSRTGSQRFHLAYYFNRSHILHFIYSAGSTFGLCVGLFLPLSTDPHLSVFCLY